MASLLDHSPQVQPSAKFLRSFSPLEGEPDAQPRHRQPRYDVVILLISQRHTSRDRRVGAIGSVRGRNMHPAKRLG